jgi:hypothetical protein
MLAEGIGLALLQLASAYAMAGVAAHPGSLPAAKLAGTLSEVSFSPVVFLIAFMFLLFPTGKLPSPRWRPVAAAGLLLAGLTTAGLVVTPRLLRPSNYLVEWYQPASRGEQVELTAQRIGESVTTLPGASAAELLLTLFLPGDEVVFCLFAAPSFASVEQACRRADVRFDRIGHAITFPQLTSSAPGAHPAAAASFASPVPGYRGPAPREEST